MRKNMDMSVLIKDNGEICFYQLLYNVIIAF